MDPKFSHPSVFKFLLLPTLSSCPNTINSAPFFISYICLFFIFFFHCPISPHNQVSFEQICTFIHLSWVLQAIAQIHFLCLRYNHINQLHCTVTNFSSLIEYRNQVWVWNMKSHLTLQAPFIEVSVILCSILIFSWDFY